MKFEDTICYKIDQTIDSFSDYQNGKKSLDIVKITRNLYEIQKQAMHMEIGLKKRKKRMVKAGLEENYQKTKHDTETPGIDEIKNIAERRKEVDLHFEIIVKDLSKGGKIMYQKKSYAGVISMVEEIAEIFDENGVTHAKAQTFYFGNPLAWAFAFDQLKRAMTPHLIEIHEHVKKYHPEFFKKNDNQKKAIEQTLKIIQERSLHNKKE